MSQEWNIRSRAHICSFCQKPLIDRAPVVSALKETPGGYERFDAHPECWKAAEKDWTPFSQWDGVYFAPVDSGAFMRPVISREEAEALIDSIPNIEPAICRDNRFNHVDAFYKELFRQHSCEALVAIVKGLHLRMSEKKTRSSRAESTMKRAKDILHGELSIALGMEFTEVEGYIRDRLEPDQAD